MDAAQTVHEALQNYLDDGEIAVSWVLTIEVAGQDGVRYLAHRAGGGIDGADAPTAWAAMGLLKASLLTAEDQVLDYTRDADDDDDDPE